MAPTGMAPPQLPCAHPRNGPLLAIPSELAPLWTAGDARAQRAEDRVTIAGWVHTGSIAVGSGRALLLDGPLGTCFLATDEGGVLVRGGRFGAPVTLEKECAKPLRRKRGWTAHRHDLELREGRLWIFDAASAGAKRLKDVAAEYGTLDAALGPGRYAVDCLGSEDEAGPVVFIRLRRR